MSETAEIIRLGKIALTKKKKEEKAERDFTKVFKEQILPVALRETKRIPLDADQKIFKVGEYELEVERITIDPTHPRPKYHIQSRIHVSGVSLKQAKLMKKIIDEDIPKVPTTVCDSTAFSFRFDSFSWFVFDNSRGKVYH